MPVHPSGVLGGVVDEVGHHPFDAPLVDPEPQTGHVGIDVDRHIAGAGRLGRLADQLTDLHLVERELGRTGVHPADLEEVVDHALEPAQLGR